MPRQPVAVDSVKALMTSRRLGLAATADFPEMTSGPLAHYSSKVSRGFKCPGTILPVRPPPAKRMKLETLIIVAFLTLLAATAIAVGIRGSWQMRLAAPAAAQWSGVVR